MHTLAHIGCGVVRTILRFLFHVVFVWFSYFVWHKITKTQLYILSLWKLYCCFVLGSIHTKPLSITTCEAAFKNIPFWSQFFSFSVDRLEKPHKNTPKTHRNWFSVDAALGLQWGDYFLIAIFYLKMFILFPGVF